MRLARTNQVLQICGCFASILASIVNLQGQSEINLERLQTSVEPVPIQLEGFTGEALQVLTFDLEVMGWDVVPAGKGQFALIGDRQGGLRGRLVDRLGGDQT